MLEKKLSNTIISFSSLLHVSRRSKDKFPKVLADIKFHFTKTEFDPIFHLRAIVSKGHISGMPVYPGYFKLLGGKAQT